MISLALKGADLNKLVQGGQRYGAFPLSKASLLFPEGFYRKAIHSKGQSDKGNHLKGKPTEKFLQ